MSETTIHAAPGFETFILRNRGDWAFFTLNDETGWIIVASSYGTWSHCWHARGEGVTLKEFLIGLNFDYVAGKFRIEQVADDKATTNNVRERLIALRREGRVTKEDARQAYDAADYFSGAMEFMEVMGATRWGQSEGELYDYIIYEYEPGFTHFWNDFWQPFEAKLAAELQEAA